MVMVRCNYKTNDDNDIISLTTFPLNENEPIMELSQHDFEILSKQIMLNYYKNIALATPALRKFYAPKIEALEKELNDML